MSAVLQVATPSLMPASPAVLATLDQVYGLMEQCEQVHLPADHLIHGGMYARTLRLPWNDQIAADGGLVVLGSLIRCATVLIVNGDMAVLTGDERVDLTGYNVIPGCAGRKQLVVTRGPVEVTMIFPTQAKTVEEAEEEIFGDVDKLQSRKDSSRDTITITGE